MYTSTCHPRRSGGGRGGRTLKGVNLGTLAGCCRRRLSARPSVKWSGQQDLHLRHLASEASSELPHFYPDKWSR